MARDHDDCDCDCEGGACVSCAPAWHGEAVTALSAAFPGSSWRTCPWATSLVEGEIPLVAAIQDGPVPGDKGTATLVAIRVHVDVDGDWHEAVLFAGIDQGGSCPVGMAPRSPAGAVMAALKRARFPMVPGKTGLDLVRWVRP